jgi:hypothetical protein
MSTLRAALTAFAVVFFLSLPWPGAAQRAVPQGPGAVTPAAPEPPPAVRWIDAHVHLVGGRGANTDFPGAVDAAVREMDRFGIAFAIVMPTPQVESQQAYDYPSYVAPLKRYPGRFAFLAGGGSLNAYLHHYADPSRVTDKVKQEFAAGAEKMIDAGAVGFGEIASLHVSMLPGHPYAYVPPDHPLLLALADVAAKRDVPIDLHMDAVEREMPTPPATVGGTNPPTLPATLAGLPKLLAHNRGARIVWAHGGSDPIGGMSAGTIETLMDTHPNLYVSLRIVNPYMRAHNRVFSGPGALDHAWRDLLAKHPDRFVLGSDSFMLSPNLRGTGPGAQFAERNEPKLRATVIFLGLLAPDAAKKIGRDNAIRIYKLPVK